MLVLVELENGAIFVEKYDIKKDKLELDRTFFGFTNREEAESFIKFYNSFEHIRSSKKKWDEIYCKEKATGEHDKTGEKLKERVVEVKEPAGIVEKEAGRKKIEIDFADVIQDFRIWCLSKLSPSTVDTYISVLKRMYVQGKLDCKQIPDIKSPNLRAALKKWCEFLEDFRGKKERGEGLNKTDKLFIRVEDDDVKEKEAREIEEYIKKKQLEEHKLMQDVVR